MFRRKSRGPGATCWTLAGGNQSVARCNACSEPSALQGETSKNQDVDPGDGGFFGHLNLHVKDSLFGGGIH